MSKYFNLCQKFVAPLKLSDVVGAGSALLFGLIYSVGFMKTIVLTSFVGLVAGIAGQDLAGGPKVMVDNFPTRSKAFIEKQIPFLRGKVSNRAAMGVMVSLAFLLMQSSIFTATIRPVERLSKSRGSFSKVATIDTLMLEMYYSLGYEDAIKGRLHGTSLEGKLLGTSTRIGATAESRPETIETGTAAEDEQELSGGSKRKPTMMRLLRLPNFASIIYLYRSVVELGTDRTNLFSIGQLAANFQHHVEWWRKLVLLVSAYHVIRIFV